MLSEEKRIQYYKTKYANRTPEKRLYLYAQARAYKRKLELDITPEDISIPAICPVLGIPIFSGSGAGGFTDNSPSVDRINPNKGYTKDNIRVISHRANRLKYNATLEEIRLIYKDLLRIRLCK